MKFQQQIRIFLSLWWLFFFGPYIHSFLKNTKLDISQEDRFFIRWYAKVWYINIAIAVLVSVMWVYDTIYPTYFVAITYKVLMYVLVVILLIGSVLVFLKTPVLKNVVAGQSEKSEKFIIWEVSQGQSDILKSFVPCYNLYLWYKVHQFSHPFRWIKESIIWNFVFVIVVLLFHSTFLSAIVLFWLVLRVITLMMGIDLISAHYKNNINSLFFVNIEEVWWDLKWLVYTALKKVIDKNYDVSISQWMIDFKKKYSLLYKFHENKYLIVEYIIFVSVILYYIYWLLLWNSFWIGFGLEVLMLIIVISRYVVMIPYWQFPLVPLIHEVVEFVQWIWNKLWILK